MSHSPLYLAGREAERVGNWDAAVSNYAAVKPRDPSYLAALLRLGGLAARQGNFVAAKVYYEQALAVDGKSAEALECLAAFARDGGAPHRGVELYERALRNEPGNPRLWLGLAECHLALWMLTEAVAEFRKTLKVAPGWPLAHERLGIGLWRAGHTDEARQELATAIKLDPKLWTAWALQEHLGGEGADLATLSPEEVLALGNADANLGSIRTAEIAFREAGNERLLARLLHFAGRYAEAEEVLQKTPLEEETMVLRVRGRKMTANDRDLLVSGESLPESASLAYALGKGWDDLGEYPRAFQWFQRANALADSTAPGDREIFRKTNEVMRETFQLPLFERLAKEGNPSAKPIFIVGMIRSGTTLVEQIISSHPLVAAGGELPFLSSNAGELLPEIAKNKGKIKRFAERYLKLLRHTGGDKERVTDKMPANLTLVGLIHVLFPNANIIHCDRAPRDVCFSAYVTPHDRDHPFLHTPEDLAFYYAEAHRLAENWQTVLPPSRFTSLSYERLVTEPKSTIRTLLEWLDLPDDPACYRQEENPRLVHTPSEWQVRQPIHQSSLGRWKHYPEWTRQLDAALESLGISV